LAFSQEVDTRFADSGVAATDEDVAIHCCDCACNGALVVDVETLSVEDLENWLDFVMAKKRDNMVVVIMMVSLFSSNEIV